MLNEHDRARVRQDRASILRFCNLLLDHATRVGMLARDEGTVLVDVELLADVASFVEAVAFYMQREEENELAEGRATYVPPTLTELDPDDRRARAFRELEELSSRVSK